MPAFSTCWNSSRHSDGESMIEEIVALGFDEIELSHGMTIAKIPGIRRAFARGIFRCTGVHNFFPSPVEIIADAPDAYQFTSKSALERHRAKEATRLTLRTAAEFGARYVVLHLGSVPMNPRRWTDRLTGMLEAGDQESPKFLKRREAFLRKRTKIGPAFLQRAVDTLGEFAESAAELGLVLAVESRSRLEDCPSEAEMRQVMDRFRDNPAVRYWHDFGHVQLKHNLGLLDHASWLAEMAPFLAGCHLHDVEWPARDHRVPFSGSIDFPKLLPLVPKGLPIVWELSPTRDAEDIRDALTVWRRIFPDRP
jgi:sugar phosphate isomerase/epimerase